jgi:two-component system, NarL family, sensor kinase
VAGAASGAAPGKVRLGWGVSALSSAVLVAALALDLEASSYKTLAYLGANAVLALLGALLTTRMPEHPISWVLAITALWGSVGGLVYAYAVEALVAAPGSLPGGLVAAWLDNWWWLPAFALPLSTLLLLMPNGRLASPRWRAVPVVVVVGTVLGTVAVSTSPTFDLGDAPSIENPLARAGGTAVAAAGIVGVVLVVVGLLASLVSFVVRFRSSDGEEQQQLRWVAASLCLAVPLFVVGALLWGAVPGAEVLPVLASLALPTGIAVAVLNYRLYEIDLVVNRALVYGLLTVCVVGGYVAVVGLVGATLSSDGDLVLSLLVTGVVAVGFQPLRARVQRFVNRLMYGERDDPYSAIAGLGRTLAASLQPDTVLPTIVETLGRTLALQYVGVALADDGVSEDRRAVAEYGTRGPGMFALPLVHRGVEVGGLRLAARQGERLRERDHRLIVDLTPQVAAAVHAVGLTQELQLARQHIVELREEERRRIRRDLHDGLGPALAGVVFGLDAARNSLARDPAGVDAALAELKTELQASIGDVRRLVYDLRPPALDQLGLVPALEEYAARLGERGALQVSVSAPPMPELPAAVEVAAYRIATEALTNAARHSGALSTFVTFDVTDVQLRLSVVDDGGGINGHRGTGIGLTAMAERAAELGGTCSVSAPDGGGTAVVAVLPLRATS